MVPEDPSAPQPVLCRLGAVLSILTLLALAASYLGPAPALAAPPEALELLEPLESPFLTVADSPDPRAPGVYPTAVTELDEGCSYDLDQAAPVFWTDPAFGYNVPEQVVFGDNDDSASDVRCPGRPALLVDMVTRVFYPGTATAVAPGGPYPVVVFMHGQQLFQIPGYQGYDYLGKLLASHGFVVVSIDGRSLLDSTIKSRGEHIREHLRRLVKRNARGSGSFLEGKLDLNSVALVGHSRGGDAIAAAWEWQRVAPDPGYTIAALVAIAPVQFFGWVESEPDFISHIRDVPYQIIHGSKDGDVSDFQGLREYDRAADVRAPGETLKSMVFVKDANHNYFNTVWETEEGSDYRYPGVLEPSVQRDLAEVYIHAFLEVTLQGDESYRGYLTGELPNPVKNTQVALDFQAPGSEFLSIDHFEIIGDEPHDADVNSLDGEVLVSPDATAAQYAERSLRAWEARPWASYPGETWGGSLQWLEPSLVLHELPEGWLEAADPTLFTHLSLRVGQVYRAKGSVNPPLGQQTFQVRLTDGAGNHSPWVSVSQFAPIYPPWETRAGGIKTVMSVVRLPLSAFTGVEPELATQLELQFQERATGELVLDDLRLSR